jgi:LuxR family maltose regulon positive regulatory protein
VLTLVCAPAGYGKTTLLSQWAEADAGTTRFAWVTLDEGDADPVRFWTYLVSALSAVAAAAGWRSLPALSRHPERMTTEALPLLMEELEEGDQDLVLVLEDYHRAEWPPVAELLAFFIERRPLRLQVVLSTRSDPQLPLGRWRANGQLSEVRADRLQFSEREVEEFFDRTGAGDLSRAELDKLTVRTDGWPSVLRLAAILLRSQPDREAFVRAFTGSTRHVAEYLASDVLQTVSPRIRGFLLRTSILPRLCGPLCDAVTGTEQSAATLRELDRANLFISPLGGDGRWYRYHQLFAEALRLELEITHPNLAPELATARATAAGQRSRPDEAGRWLDVAAEGPRDGLTSAGVPLGYGVDLLRSFFLPGSVSSAHEAAQRAVAEAPDPLWRGAALAGLGQCRYLLGDPDGAAEALREALTLIRGDLNMLALASGYLALVECDQGNPRQAERIARRAVDAAESAESALSGIGVMAHTGLGAALTAQGRLAEADDRLSFVVGLHDAGSPSIWLAHALILLAGCRYHAGDAAWAREALEEATGTLARIPGPGIMPELAASMRGRLLAPGRRAAAFGQELSEREVVVLGLLATGLSQREIAAQLYVSPNTVKTHIRATYRKLGAGTRAQAPHRARDLGLLPRSPR